jgi:2-oxoisovalerate dehydrogenase E1 component
MILKKFILGSLSTHPHDTASGHHRPRPFVMSLGIDLDEVVVSPFDKLCFNSMQ